MVWSKSAILNWILVAILYRNKSRQIELQNAGVKIVKEKLQIFIMTGLCRVSKSNNFWIGRVSTKKYPSTSNTYLTFVRPSLHPAGRIVLMRCRTDLTQIWAENIREKQWFVVRRRANVKFYDFYAIFIWKQC